MFFRLMLAALLFLAFPTVAQEEDEPGGTAYFSIATNRTWGPGDKPTLQLWGSHVNKLEFRLYRVNDPVKFFELLQDEHAFGGRAPRRDQKKLTKIERIHQWKLRTRDRIKDTIRGQFTMAARIQFRQWRNGEPPEEARRIELNQGQVKQGQKKRASKPAVTEFANVPLLNEQQLVAKWVQPFRPKNRWDAATVEIPVRGKGLYLIEATDGNLQAYTIASVSDIAVITKSMPGRMLARVVDRGNGAPVPGVQIVSWIGSDKKRLLETTAGADGFAEVKVNESDPDGLVVLAKKGDDFSVVSLYGTSVGIDEDRTLTGYIYTDRPVYRPGHTVFFKGIFRHRETLGYRVPDGKPVDVEISDSEGNPVHKTSLKISGMGTVNGKFALPQGAGLGNYSLVMKSGESYNSAMFGVEEYKKPEYEVKVNVQSRRVVQGASVQAVLEGRYFYGEPVANAKVTWVVHKSRYWLPYELDDEEPERDSSYEQREQVSEESGVLGPDGKLTVNIPTGSAEYDLRYRIEARVTDQAGREISGAGFAVATVGPYHIRIDPEQYVYEPGAMGRFIVETRDYDDNPVPNVAFHVALREHQWRGPEGALVGSVDGRTDAQGKARVEMKLTAGSLYARATSRTPQGRDVIDMAYVWVSGGASWYGGTRSERIEIVPDKKSYKPGETAKVLIVAGQPNTHLWVTVEGRAIHQSHFIASKEATVSVDVPIRREYAPNFFVSAATIRNNEMVYGTRLVKVPADEQTLKVDLKPSKAEFKPGEPASYILEARDYAGKPVAGEFSVGVVDEALYTVRPDSTQDIARFFYGREWNHISTDNSLQYYFSGQAGKRRMQLARIRPWTARANLKPELVQPKVRKAFPDTAFWSAEVRTDSSGRAKVDLEFPDALTTWRATARGITADTKVGSAVNRVIVRKNLLVRLAVPRFFRVGDEMTVTAIAENYLTREKQVRLSLEAKGLDIVDGPARELRIPSKGNASVDYRVRVPRAGSAVLLVKALTDEESDAMELTLPVIPFGVKLSDSRAGTLFGSAAQADAELTFPAGIDPSSRTIEITASASVAGTVFDALEYLTSFPYGCTEQTMSSFLPNVVVSKAVRELGLKGRVNEAELVKKTKAGYERLSDFQHEDGGWGWWKTDESDAFMTAYVLAGLRQAQGTGVDIEDARLEKAAGWLLREVKSTRRMQPDLRAYVGYALSVTGYKDAGFWNALYAERNSMTAYGVALLGLGLDQIGDKRAFAIAEGLESAARTSEREAWWPVDRDDLMNIYMDTTPEATAYAMKLLSKLKPESPVLPKAAVWLVANRNGGYYWRSTKQTAMVIYGLTDYLKRSGELKPNFEVTVSVNDKAVLTRKFTEAEARALTPVVVKLTADQLAAGGNRIKVTRSGEGRLYWSARSEYYSTAGAMSPRGSNALNLRRDYFLLQPVETGGKIVHRLQPLNGPVSQGDVIAVRLTLEGGDWRYLMVEDPLPAGAEAVERDDLYTIAEKPPWWRYWFSRRELRDDRAAFFQSWLDRERQYFYLMKVVNPGTFRISPARAEPMYQPEFLATTDPAMLEVRSREGQR